MKREACVISSEDLTENTSRTEASALKLLSPLVMCQAELVPSARAAARASASILRGVKTASSAGGPSRVSRKRRNIPQQSDKVPPQNVG